MQPVFCELSLFCISASASSAASVSGGSRDLVPYNRNTGLRHSGLSRLWVGTNISVLILAGCACQAGLIVVLSFPLRLLTLAGLSLWVGGSSCCGVVIRSLFSKLFSVSSIKTAVRWLPL